MNLQGERNAGRTTSSSISGPGDGVGQSQALELFLDIFNTTNRANLHNRSADQRVPSTSLVLTNLRGGGGFPRQAQLGMRYEF